MRVIRLSVNISAPALATMPARGRGYRQVLVAAAPEDHHSQQADELLELWSWGQLSIPLVYRLATAAIADGARGEDLKKLQRLSHPSRSNLEQALPSRFVGAALISQRLLLKKSPRVLELRDVCMLLPHELFAALWTWDHAFFISKLCGGPADRIATFWDKMAGHPALGADSPILARPDHRTRCIPLAVHGDGVACTGISKSWSKSADALSWRSLLSNGPVRSTQFLVFVMSWQLMVNAGNNATWPSFVRKFAWSLYWLFIGKWPRRDHMGNPYPADTIEGRRAARDEPLAGGSMPRCSTYRGTSTLCI